MSQGEIGRNSLLIAGRKQDRQQKKKKKKDKKYDRREIPSAPYIGIPVTLLRDCTH